MKDEELLVEVEDLMRTMPDQASIWENKDENLSWLGRVSAVIEAWSLPKTVPAGIALTNIGSGNARSVESGVRTIVTLLHQAKHDLRMKTVGPVNVAVDKGMVFHYFDEIRKIIEEAKVDLLFVDPYLDAEFISRYMESVSQGVSIRLLTKVRLKTLLPAVEVFVKQSGANIEVRSSDGLHDRFLFVDDSNCYQSGASFKDGAKASPTTLTQITDAFTAIRDTYENIWSAAKVE